jgi:hypothetical protein
MSYTTQQHSVINGVYVGPEKWSGELNLNVYAHEITSLGNLREVSGQLNVAGCNNLISLGELTFVGGSLNLNRCEKLSNLGKLHTVGVSNISTTSVPSNWSIDLDGCHSLISLSNLTKVVGALNVYSCKNLVDIGKMRFVGGRFTISSLNLSPIDEGLSPTDRVDIIRDRITYFQSLPIQEALNAIHSDEVRCTPYTLTP